MNFVHPLKDAWSRPWFLQCPICCAVLLDSSSAKRHAEWHVEITPEEPKLGNWDTV